MTFQMEPCSHVPRIRSSSFRDLHTAVASGARWILVDSDEELPQPLRLPSSCRLELRPGCAITAKRGAFAGKYESLISIVNQENVELVGFGGALDMSEIAGSPDAQNHLVEVRGSRNVLCAGLALFGAAGDAFYVGPDLTKHRIPCKGVRLSDAWIDHPLRNGISVVSCDGFVARGVRVIHVNRGAMPMAGIDFEPAKPVDLMRDCSVIDCEFRDVGDRGVLVALHHLSAESDRVSIGVEHCAVWDSARAGVECLYPDNGGPAGYVKLDVSFGGTVPNPWVVGDWPVDSPCGLVL